MEKVMVAKLFLFLAMAAAPVAVVNAQSSQSYRLSPRAIPPQPSNIAGTTPQRIERGPSIRERVSRARDRFRARRSR
jgi:hypothetical protein